MIEHNKSSTSLGPLKSFSIFGYFHGTNKTRFKEARHEPTRDELH